MVRAYCPLKSVVQFSLTKMTQILAFEDVSHCAQFCTLHGLSPELDTDTIYMERTSFYYPETLTSSLQRARNLIESKRQDRWSVVINGNQPFPANPYLTYVPHSSFDNAGFLKSDDASDQSNVETEEDMQKRIQEELRRQREAALKQALEHFTRDVINEVVEEQVGKIAEEELAMAQAIQWTFASVQTEVVSEMASETARVVMKEARNEELKKRLDKEAKIAAVEDIHEDLIEELVLEASVDIAQAEMARVQTLNKCLDLAPGLVEDLINDVIKHQIGPNLTRVLDDMFKERELKIQALKTRQVLLHKRKMFKSWLRYVRKRKSQRSILDKFPCLPSSLHPRDQFKTHLRACNIKEILRIKKQVEKLHDIIELEDKFVEESILEPMHDLPDCMKVTILNMF